MTLMVILGAGASHDCIGGTHVRDGGPGKGLPLTKDLVEVSAADSIARQFPDLAGPVHALRRNLNVLQAGAGQAVGAVSLEQVLRGWRDELDSGRPATHRAAQLVGVQWYIQERVKRAEASLGDLRHVSSYLALVDRIEDWRSQRDEQVMYVTFNYDTLLEAALLAVLGRSFGSEQDYVAGRTTLLKPHGSINWWHLYDPTVLELPWEASMFSDSLHQRRYSMEHAAELIRSAERWQGDPVMDGPHGKPEIPAIAIPMTDKSDFVWPRSQHEHLKKNLQGVDRLLIVGWRGAESHFRTLIRGRFLKAVEAVANSESGASDLIDGLRADSVVASSDAVRPHPGGFSTFAENPDWLTLS